MIIKVTMCIRLYFFYRLYHVDKGLGVVFEMSHSFGSRPEVAALMPLVPLQVETNCKLVGQPVVIGHICKMTRVGHSCD